MAEIKSLIDDYRGKNIAIYGLGTETERFLSEWGDKLSIVCLLDGFKSEGEMYGYQILPHQAIVDLDVKLVIVVARPGSCKAITKRIGPLCSDNGISLFDVRGKDLLAAAKVTYDSSNIDVNKQDALFEKINKADIVSFDLFDTLIVRKVYSYTDIFELVDTALKERGIVIPDFAKLRLSVEKELSKAGAPGLETIYQALLDKAEEEGISAAELADLEWKTDLSSIMPRYAMIDVFRKCIDFGKRVFITTDSYYNLDQIKGFLDAAGIDGYEDVLVSSEYDLSKTQGLLGKLRDKADGIILHVGDDTAADIESANKEGFDSYKIYSCVEYYDALGGLGLEGHINSLSDRARVGALLSRIFNNPFCFEEESGISVHKAEDIGYLFFAPMISDFVMWLKKETKEQGYSRILFGARDGYLIEKLYKKIDPDTKGLYFLTSRTAAIRAGVKSVEDIEYVNSMRFFGSDEAALYARFGIEAADLNGESVNKIILEKAGIQRRNYLKYIDKLGIVEDKLALFDFVAKGTVQLYLERIFDEHKHIKGFYFLQLEPEFMADKNLDIQPFYENGDKNESEIYDNYYILETVLTAPYAQLEEFDDNGEPVYAVETRSISNIQCFEKMQQGIERWFDEYIQLIPESARLENKKLDEAMLALVNKVVIKDEGFLELTVEDPFFGRMTDIKNVIG